MVQSVDWSWNRKLDIYSRVPPAACVKLGIGEDSKWKPNQTHLPCDEGLWLLLQIAKSFLIIGHRSSYGTLQQRKPWQLKCYHAQRKFVTHVLVWRLITRQLFMHRTTKVEGALSLIMLWRHYFQPLLIWMSCCIFFTSNLLDITQQMVLHLISALQITCGKNFSKSLQVPWGTHLTWCDWIPTWMCLEMVSLTSLQSFPQGLQVLTSLLRI